MKFIVKFFPEIMIKGDAVKKRMINRVQINISKILQPFENQIEIKKYRDKLDVVVLDESKSSAILSLLLDIPGIDQVWQTRPLAFEGLEDLAEKAVEFALPRIKNKTFVVRLKRSGTHDFTSVDAERKIGGILCARGEGLGVKMKGADEVVELDVLDKQLNLIEYKHTGRGGYPLGSQGQALSLMSGGFDSTVASYLSIKRGIKTHFVFFNLGGTAHELGVKQVAIYLWNRFSSTHPVQFVTIPFEEVVDELLNSVHDSYMGVMLKRLMLQAAEQVADKMELDTLITGESVAQVSSQTLRNLAVIDRVTNKLVLRPLGFMNKEEIMSLADEIGTKEFAEAMPEYCGVISRNPVTEASFKRIEREEKRFNFAVLDAAIEQMESVPVHKLIDEIVEAQPVETVQELTEQDIIIDIRPEAERASHPLEISNSEAIPFTDLTKVAKNWDKNKRYLLYCQKGVMSQLHAQYLRDQGYENVMVYRL